MLTRERTRLGALILSDKFAPPQPEEIQSALAKAIPPASTSSTGRTPCENLLARIATLRTVDPTIPDLSRETLSLDHGHWLAPYLAGMTNLRETKSLDLHTLLRAQLTHEQAMTLDNELPVELRLPRGTIRIDYTDPIPVASARAQIFYGTDATPQLAKRQTALATRPALPRRTAHRHHRRPRHLLARWLGRCQA